ncbi:two-component system sensor histidine kinase KdpD [Agromyces flavus]|uniref:histidine kinase n=1 Tax=Agromyces flavus TaxID=589382 RepID=A0A1H1Z5L2_9MICO|nr:ATP-binding protein [Agromyces flavus]MCP2366921.1 two-component system sensor histidine kinase KdpD [Agromyces flavus]GGI46756.1 sensor histidine kinase [Agromyces flavus]SDT28506.1 two-component system, OmpR family, sensor histidine kinase KdpD [Agromyces flavus]
MRRGRLRVLLGAAPGVGKTYTMLEEGRRLRDEGRDVVVGFVEPHGRAATAAMVDGLEVVPRRTETHRGLRLEEMDLDAVLARKPEIALVDELAHTNAPGSRHPKRWQDVEDLLAAGIDVISTVNTQHIESLGDVVYEITGAQQRETIPDAVLRGADQVEVVDLAPQALRDRLATGLVYPAERIDAALSNYFRLGNLTALRELALLWLADEVDQALKAYRAEHGITGKWEARERVVVALTGGPEGETLLRRGARIAARSSGGELLAVHVTSPDGLRARHPEALDRQRTLVERLGGTYHEVVGEDIPKALVDFARASDATQLVIGVSRRSRLTAAFTGPGIGATVIRESGDIDVHIVTHAAAGSAISLPRLGGALSRQRLIAGFAVALVAGPLLSWLLWTLQTDASITSDVLAYQLLVIIVALIGGLWPGLFAAVLSGITLNFLFIEPRYTLSIGQPRQLLALGFYVVNALLVSYVVDQAARRSREARRSEAESQLLVTIAGSVLRGEDALQAMVTRTREAFGLAGVRLLVDGEVRVADGEPTSDDRHSVVPIGTRGVLELHGHELEASERRLLAVIATQMDAAIEQGALATAASAADSLAETDRVRSALLAAVGHDLRRPLTAASAAVSALRADDVKLGRGERRELLATAAESLDSLAGLVTNLLDVSRVQAGALAVTIAPTEIADVVFPALEELHAGPGELELELPDDGPRVLADAVLLQRVVVNLLANAMRFSPPGERVLVTASAFRGSVQLRIVDRGPGIPPERRDQVFTPFQRLGDTDNDTGLGLGLALSKGFVEGMDGTLDVEDTPGGGVTMVVTLPAEEADA